MAEKVVTLESLAELVKGYKQQGQVVSLCHGCFDLVHPGHIRHLKEARRVGDVLVVTVTPDRYVNKGPGRPLFPEQLRLEQLAALEFVSHVALNRWPTAIEMLELVQPSIYVKGSDYEDHSQDITGNIRREAEAVERHGGRVHYTHDIVFSSTKLINRNFQLLPPESQAYIERLRHSFSADDIEALIERLSKLKVVVFGDAIIDEYCYCRPMGRVEKAPIISLKYMQEERYAGGILAVANHAAQFAGEVRLVTMVGDKDAHREFAEKALDPRVKATLLVRPDKYTTTKRRFLTHDGRQKVFEVGYIDDEWISPELESEVRNRLEQALGGADLLIVADFGHGLITQGLIDFVEAHAVPIAVNAQTNSTNFGYNYITRYRHADFISIDENEIRLPLQARGGDIEPLVGELVKRISCPRINVTLGQAGSVYYSDHTAHRAPALAMKIVDTVGAGDAVFSVLSLAYRADIPAELMPFLGNSVGALAVEIMGNKEPVTKGNLIKFVRGLLA